MVCDRFSGQVFCRMSFCLGLAVCNAFFSQWLVGVVLKAIAFSPVHLLTPMLPFPGEGPPLHPQSYLPDLHFACPAYLSQQHPCAELPEWSSRWHPDSLTKFCPYSASPSSSFHPSPASVSHSLAIEQSKASSLPFLPPASPFQPLFLVDASAIFLKHVSGPVTVLLKTLPWLLLLWEQARLLPRNSGAFHSLVLAHSSSLILQPLPTLSSLL